MKKVIIVGAFSLAILMRAFGQTSDPIVVDSVGNVAITGSSTVTITAPNLIINEVEYSVIPEGAIIMWSGEKVPDGWALCDGTPPTPDLRQQFIAGYDDRIANEDYNKIGDQGGASSVALTIEQMPSHSHGVYDPGHSHGYLDRHPTNGHWDEGNNDNNNWRSEDDMGRTTYGATTGISINANGGSKAHENRPPFYVLAYIMKIKTKGTNTVLAH